jgi:hypothetical protein
MPESTARGVALHLIRASVDGLKFFDGGTRVIFTKGVRIESASDERGA